MTDLTTLAQRYLDLWNTTEADARRSAVDELFSPTGRYVDPLGRADGPAAIDATIAAVQAQFPGYVFRLAGPVDAHHDQARFTWELAPAGADPRSPAPVVGFDVAVVDAEGRLEAVLGFLDRVPG